MSGKAVSKSKKPVLQHARELPNDAQLEQGDNWFAVATSWWDQFQAAPKAKDAPSLSSKTRKVSILKPKLEEGADFVFVPEASWEVIARGLDFDWEIRREVIYQRSQQMLQIEPYPFAFKIFSWTADETEPVELVDDAGREVVVLGSRNHSLGQVLSEVWLAAPVEFHRQFPELLGSVDPICSSLKSLTTASDDQQIPNSHITHSLRLKRRAKKRQEREKEASCDERSSDESEAEFDVQLKEDHPEMNVKLVASGSARLHELLIEQKPKGDGDMGWPTQGRELQWRMTLAKGDLLDALDTSREWFEARLLAARRNKVHVHYRSWETKWDEWISRGECTSTASLVQVGLEVPRLKHTKWRNATVIEVVPTRTLRHKGSDGVGLRVHVQVDDDDIWLPAHDDLLCRSNTHNESSPLTKRERRLLSHDDSLASETIEEAAEEAGEDEEEYEVVEADGDEQDSDDPNLMDHEGPSSPPPRATNAAELAAASRAARSLSQVLLRLKTDASRRLGVHLVKRGAAAVTSFQQRHLARASIPSSKTDRSNSRELRTMWAKMSRDLQALQASWTQLGEGLFAAVEGVSVMRTKVAMA
ncbi:Chromo domain-like [Phytophthora cactorum]|nr:Chromo domain-like [Phytophthora cactorum]